MQKNEDEEILTFTFQAKPFKLKCSTTFGQLFAMEFKSFLCCGKKKFDDMRWERNDKRIFPVIDEKISEIIMNGDVIWCNDYNQYKRNWCEFYNSIKRMQTGLNGSDFSEVFEQNNSILKEVQSIIQQAL